MAKKRFSKGRKRFSRKGRQTKDETPEPESAIVLEHPTKKAARELRKNRRESRKKGQDPRPTSPMRPTIVRDEDAEGEFRPGVNDITIHTIGNLLANGLSAEFAAPLAGIPPGTLSYWLSLGRKRRKEIVDWWERAQPLIESDESDESILEQLGPCPTMIEHVKLINRVEKCRAQAHENLFLVVWNAAEGGDVPAAQWLLERLYSRQYGKQAREPIPVKDEEEVSRRESKRDPVKELQRRVIELFERKRARRGS